MTHKIVIYSKKKKTHQDTIEGTRIASALHVTQNGDARILIQL